MTARKATAFALACLCLPFGFACNQQTESVAKTSLPDTSQATQYSLIKSNVFLDQVNNTNFLVNNNELAAMSRRNIKVHFSCGDAQTADKRAHTVMKAAIDVQKATNAHIVEAFCELDEVFIGAGYSTARVVYAASGRDFGGVGEMQPWEVWSSDQSVTPQQVEIGKLWFRHREKFRRTDGSVDEPRLKSFLAQKYGIAKDELGTPLVLAERYKPMFAGQ